VVRESRIQNTRKPAERTVIMTLNEQGPSLHLAIEAAVAAATRAPSIHNTQPWHFRVSGRCIELLADHSRQLDVIDPTSRQLYISCGAALHHLRVSLRAAGYTADVALQSAKHGTDRLARILVEPGDPATAREKAAAAAIVNRHTQRDPFSDQNVESKTLAELRHAAETEGAWLSILRERDDQITLAVLLSRADQAEKSDPDYQTELQRWRHAESLAGIPDSAIPSPEMRRHSEMTLRDYRWGEATDPTAAPLIEQGETSVHIRDERPSLVILGTDADGPAQWIAAGQALSALLLRATELGLRASMLGQVTDLPGTRGQLRTLLRLVGEPQMVLRIGYGSIAAPTPRRALTDVVN
jgi:hypothetical protein